MCAEHIKGIASVTLKQKRMWEGLCEDEFICIKETKKKKKTVDRPKKSLVIHFRFYYAKSIPTDGCVLL